MKWLESTIVWLFPPIMLEGTPWKRLWEEEERRSFVTTSRYVFPSVAIAYVAHFLFYDLPNDLQPVQYWLAFRTFIASAAALTALYYFKVQSDNNWYRVPAMITIWVICQSQAFVALWYGLESWVFCYIFVLGAVLALRLSAFKSLLFVLFTLSTQGMVLVEAGVPVTYIFTGSIVCVVMSLITRATYLNEVRSFKLNQENIAAQKQIIELNIEFSERIRSFIPRVIADRLETLVEKGRMSVIEASIEVLSPSRKHVACLFTDIRGFTQGSKNLQKFVGQSVIPEVKLCSDAVESYEGIPRKIGDLVFAYFDSDYPEINAMRALASGLEIARRNQDLNETYSEESIRRYVLISTGEAIVGNLGGLDSSIEITALGNPVNLLSRLDELTKDDALASKIRFNEIVLSPDAYEEIRAHVDMVEVREICLADICLQVRDFPEVRSVYIVQAIDENIRRCRDWLATVCAQNPSDRIGKRRLFAA